MEQKKPNTKSKAAGGREERLKAALKANMARRKAQAKARSQVPQRDESNKDKG